MGNPLKTAALLALSCAALGCRGEKTTEKVAPWQASPAASERELSEPLKLTPSGASKLTFSLPAKGATPRGSITGPIGTVETDLKDLAQTRGTIEFPLENVRIDSDGLGPDEARTKVALEWLALGVRERQDAKVARLSLQSLDEVRPLRALQGESIADPSGAGLVGKRVRAIGKGHLTIRGLGVDTSLPILIDFFYRSTDGEKPTPERVVVAFARPLRVSLKEHEIAPRDESGALDVKGQELLGSVVGNVAVVEGAVEFFPSR